MNASRVLSAVRHIDRFHELLRAARSTAQWPRFIGGYLGFLSPGYPFEFQTRGGDRLQLSDFHDLVTAWIVFCRQEYRVSREFERIVDAGANIGLFSVYAARRAPLSKVVALEPFPPVLAHLQRHVEQNGLKHRVTVRPWALGSQDGSGRMDGSFGVPSQRRTVFFPRVGDVVSGDVEVPVLALATLLEREELTQVDLLKIDVEGAEHGILASTPSAVLRRIRNIAVEYHPSGSKDELFDRILSAGFELVCDVSSDANYGVAHFTLR